MILPLFGFLFFSVITSIFAIISILLIPKVKLNILNIIAFDISGIIVFILFSVVFGLFFKDENLDSTWSVMLYFIISIISLILGGLIALFSIEKILKKFNF